MIQNKFFKNKTLKTTVFSLLGICVLAVLILSAIQWKKAGNRILPAGSDHSTASSGRKEETSSSAKETESALSEQEKIEELLSRAEGFALQYDYDRAIDVLKSEPELAGKEEVTAALSGYETAKGSLVRIDPQEVTHVFFHS